MFSDIYKIREVANGLCLEVEGKVSESRPARGSGARRGRGGGDGARSGRGEGPGESRVGGAWL